MSSKHVVSQLINHIYKEKEQIKKLRQKKAGVLIYQD